MNEAAQLPPGHRPFYPLQEIALLLALRVRKPGEDMRSTVDKVRKRMLYAVNNDELHVMAPSDEFQLFFTPQVFAWARKKWPDALSDVAIKHEEKASDRVALRAAVKNWHYPADVGKCHELLRAAYTDAEALEEELASANRELQRLRPLAERYEENREKNRRSAKRPRKNI